MPRPHPTNRTWRPSSFRVAIALPHSLPFLERFLVGVAKHARAAGWTFLRMPERVDASLEWLRDWDGDGALAAIRELSTPCPLDIPVVNILAYQQDLPLHLVSVDHREIGRMAARHLRERSFRHYAFYGFADRAYSTLRREGFAEVLAADGLTPLVLEARANTPRAWMVHQRLLQRWISRLPTPIGVFACSDERAVEILEICRRIGRRVPEDLAVIGVDNDPVMCEFADPPLTSIARNDEKAGRAAAAMLQRLMEARLRGRPAPATPEQVLVPPGEIIARRSTAMYAVSHPQVAALVARIEQNLRTPGPITNLMAGLPLGRRRLEELFQAEMGISPYQFVLRARVALARDMLRRNDGTSRTAIAAACGFTDLRQMRAALARAEGKDGDGGQEPADGTAAD